MKKFIMCLVACCTFFLCSLNVNAASIQVPYAEPTVDGNSGYLIVEFTSGSSCVFFWGAKAVSSTSANAEVFDTFMNLDIDTNTITFTFGTNLSNFNMYYHLCRYTTNKNFSIVSSGTKNNALYTYTYDVSDSTSKIAGFTFKGNVGKITADVPNNTEPSMVWGNDVSPLVIEDILEVISADNDLLEKYLPKLNSILSATQSIDSTTSSINSTLTDLYDVVDDLLQQVLANCEDINTWTLNTYETLLDVRDLIEDYFPTFNTQLQDINDTLWEMKEHLLYEYNADDRDKIQDFDSNSSSQSTELDNLNQQTQVEKPDIDDMSNKVDANLNMDIDANYGLLLSAFTSNNRILTMLLIVASVSLISYVFFGKR